MLNKKINTTYVDKLPENINMGDTFTILQSNPNKYTHSYFKYPCKFIPEIPRWAIKKYLKNDSQVIYDPFAGSGTTLLESIILNHNAYGTEIDDIAKLITKVKTTKLTKNQIKHSRLLLNNINHNGLKFLMPITAKLNNINHWYSEENINNLGKLRTFIEKIDDIEVKDFFKLIFISIIKKCSYADDISPKPYVSKKILKIPASPIIEFTKTFNKYINLMEEFNNLNIIKNAKIINGDALNTNLNLKVDLIITSPPYINAFDYARILRLENIWMGFLTEKELLEKKSKYVGTEKINKEEIINDLNILNFSNTLKRSFYLLNSLDEKRAMIVLKFFSDMKNNLIEMSKILKDDSYYVIVIGNNNIRNIEIESWKIIKEISINFGYSIELYFSYIIQNPYIRIPRKEKGGKVNKDFVLVLKKEVN